MNMENKREQQVKEMAKMVGSIEKLKQLEAFFYPVYTVESNWDSDDKYIEKMYLADNIKDASSMPLDFVGHQYLANQKARSLIISGIKEIAKELSPKEEKKDKVNMNA
jgi:hypothetical protein